MVKSKTIKFGDNVDTDQIIPAQYLSMATIQQMAPHTFEFYGNFTKDFNPGDIIAGNDNFGCGSSREQAPAVLKERGVKCNLPIFNCRPYSSTIFNLLNSAPARAF